MVRLAEVGGGGGKCERGDDLRLKFFYVHNIHLKMIIFNRIKWQMPHFSDPSSSKLREQNKTETMIASSVAVVVAATVLSYARVNAQQCGTAKVNLSCMK